ncbi:hypothetical protein BGZ75_005072 [Mortierella antarctica]|nr:hypothetical protein BGZ75_005072 [Mortierella antarctica]
MNDSSINMDNYNFPQPGHHLPQPKRRAQRHQPVKIYTLGTSSHSSPHLVYSPPPMTAPPLPTHNSNKPYNNFVGRSRSVSHSVLPLRPRADSTAARMAMEAMVQAKLDQITLRLDEFNYQSHDIYARTQELAIEFQAKAKRLYQVEDHLLRVQGKPGLSEHYLESGGMGKKPRRLTNDLEELSLGVKTLRNKFQVAGTVAATTVGWLAQLKEKKGHQDGSLRNITMDHNPTDPEDTTVDKETERAVPRPRATVSAWTTSSLDTTLSTNPDPLADLTSGGLRSPPLTPRGPLSRSSILNKGGLSGDDRTHLSSSSSHRGMNQNSKARPLSIIPDLEEPPLQISTTSTVPTAETQSPRTQETANDKSETRPSFPSTHFSPPSPASPVEAWTGFRGQEQEQGHAARAMTDSASASAALSEPKSVTGLENDATQRELEAQGEHGEHKGDQDPLAQLEPDHQQEQESADVYTSSSDDEEETWSEVDQTLEEPTPSATWTMESAQEELVATSTVTDKVVTERVETNNVDRSLDDIDASVHEDAETSDKTKDTWIQFFWRLLVRAEYFFLGTAVLGAMMPENLFAFCAGFLSAIVYGILLIRHRITAAPGTEAPQPPTGNRDKTLRKRIVKDRVRTRSYGTGSSSGFRESSSLVSRRTIES